MWPMRMAGLVVAGLFVWAQAATAQTVPPPGLHSATSAPKPKPRAKRHPKGYGFLPGYEDPIGPLPRRRALAEPRYERRYIYWGRLQYGYGSPGYLRGRWNGGSIGPCWKTTPIGPMWICG